MRSLAPITAHRLRFLTHHGCLHHYSGPGIKLQQQLQFSSFCSKYQLSFTKSWSVVASPQQNFHSTVHLNDSFKIQDEEDFNKRVLKSKKPVIVQFHATWCGPCKLLSPRMEKSIAALKDSVDLAQVDIDDNPDIAMSYSVGAVPAVMALKDGKVVDKFVGLKDEDQIDTFLAKLAT